MPRIEIAFEEGTVTKAMIRNVLIRQGQNPRKSLNWGGVGNPTLDVCKVCVKDFKLGPVPEWLQAIYGAGAKLVTLDCAHPPYGECDYDCGVCGMSLLPEDD